MDLREARKSTLENLKNNEYDVIIIGGGITGAGIALEAASKGYKVILIEKNDFASGTSSKSTKLIHGGLRYLKNLEFKLVREVGLERAVVHKIAPHITIPEKMLMPIYKNGNFPIWLMSIGLWIYDFLASVKDKDKRKILSKKSTKTKEPLIHTKKLIGSGYYAEYRTDDARLTIEIIKKSVELGAICLNYSEVSEFLIEFGKIIGVKLKSKFVSIDAPAEINEFTITGKNIINASGPWVDNLRILDSEIKGKNIIHSKGIHIVVPYKKMPIKQSIYFDISDGRMLFAIPRNKVTYIGTTDTFYNQSLDSISIKKEDVDYILKGVNNMFPNVNLRVKDIVSSWAGIRPLINQPGKSASEISRKDEIFISDSGLMTIAGGKLTGYRKMAEKIIALLKHKSSGSSVYSSTKNIVLPGGQFDSYEDVEKFKEKLLDFYPVPLELINYYVHNYGNQTTEIFEQVDFHGDWELELFKSELEFSIKNELTLTLSDFYIRRTGRLYFDIHSITPTLNIAKQTFREILGYNDQELNFQENELLTAVHNSSNFT
jgi:glycerol-3-phosphate dehydrogenase